VGKWNKQRKKKKKNEKRMKEGREEGRKEKTIITTGCLCLQRRHNNL